MSRAASRTLALDWHLPPESSARARPGRTADRGASQPLAVTVERNCRLSGLADSDRIHDPKRAMIDTDDMSKGRNLSLAGNAHEPHVDVHKHISDVAGFCPFPVASGLLASSPGGCHHRAGRWAAVYRSPTQMTMTSKNTTQTMATMV